MQEDVWAGRRDGVICVSCMCISSIHRDTYLTNNLITTPTSVVSKARQRRRRWCAIDTTLSQTYKTYQRRPREWRRRQMSLCACRTPCCWRWGVARSPRTPTSCRCARRSCWCSGILPGTGPPGRWCARTYPEWRWHTFTSRYVFKQRIISFTTYGLWRYVFFVS